MRLVNFEIKNYRSIVDESFPLKNLTVIIGRNNSGKSNVIDAIQDYLKRISAHGTDQWYGKKVTRHKEGMDIYLSAEYHFNPREHEQITADMVKQGIISPEFRENALITGDFSKARHGISVNENAISSEYFQTNFDSKWLNLSYQITEGDESLHSYDLNWNEFEGRKITLELFARNPSHGLRNRIPGVRAEMAELDFNIYTEKRSTHIWGEIITDPFFQYIDSHAKSTGKIGAIRDPQSRQIVSVSNTLRPNASNLTNTLHTLSQNDKKKFGQIADTYMKIMDGITQLRSPISSESGNVHTEVEVSELNGEISFSLDEISSGSQEILALITKIVESESNTSILFIEEPELHLHPRAQKRVLNLISAVAEGEPQVILTTHSDVFVNEASPDQILKTDRKETTTLHSIEEDRLDDTLSEMGYSQSGILQSEAVVFVEGKSDDRILSQLAEIYEFDLEENGIEVVELDGEGNIRSDGRSLIKLLHSFGVPFLFVVDSHGEEPQEVRNDLLKHINSRKGDWHVTPTDFFIWSNYGIESYLIQMPRAIQRCLKGDEDQIKSSISDFSGDDHSKLLDEIFTDEIGEKYDKNQHGMLIARHAEKEELPDEVVELLKQIDSLADT